METEMIVKDNCYLCYTSRLLAHVASYACPTSSRFPNKAMEEKVKLSHGMDCGRVSLIRCN